jgi:hypothetical protein
MNLKDLLETLQSRAPWLRAGRLILLGAGFDAHRGYEKTIDAALTQRADADRTERLKVALTEHALVGEKVLRIVRLKSGERTALSDWIGAKRRVSGPLPDAFPALANRNAIRSAEGGNSSSLGNFEFLSGAAAMYTSGRSFTERVEIAPSRLTGSVDGDIEKLIAVTKRYVQTFDALWLPAQGNFVCLLTDQPDGAPFEFSAGSQHGLMTALRRALGRDCEAVNLWPAIDGLYHTKDGSKLVDYGFVTDDESVKHHKARRGTKCLRDGTYDKAGAAAVGDDLLLFKISEAWARQNENGQVTRPELTLPGTARMLYAAPSVLDHAIVRNCLTSRDMDFVVGKLLTHL